MRVAQVNSVAVNGSTGRIVSQIGRALQTAGHEPWVAWGRGPEPAFAGHRVGKRADVLAHVARTRLADAHGLGSRGPTVDMVRALEAWSPDVVHLHNLHGYYLNYEELCTALTRLGVPVVWTLHDCWAFTGHCAYFDAVGCDRWTRHCGRCPQLREYPASLVFDRSEKNLASKRQHFADLPDTTLVTPSEWLAGLTRQSILSRHPVRVIENDPDVSVFHENDGRAWRRERGLQDSFVMLFVANIWDTRKGLDTAVALAGSLRSDEAVVIVGQIRGRAELPENVIYVPRTESASELATMYAAADVYVNPTQEDNYPTTNLEALACGTPVITFDSGGSAEALSRGAGVAVTDRTPLGLRAAIDRWRDRSDPDTPADRVRPALLTIQPGRSMAERYVDLYSQLVR